MFEKLPKVKIEQKFASLCRRVKYIEHEKECEQRYIRVLVFNELL